MIDESWNKNVGKRNPPRSQTGVFRLYCISCWTWNEIHKKHFITIFDGQIKKRLIYFLLCACIKIMKIRIHHKFTFQHFFFTPYTNLNTMKSHIYKDFEHLSINWLENIRTSKNITHLLAGVDYSSVWGPKMNILVSTSHLLITVNCSANFAIYCSKVRKLDDIVLLTNTIP